LDQEEVQTQPTDSSTSQSLPLSVPFRNALFVLFSADEPFDQPLYSARTASAIGYIYKVKEIRFPKCDKTFGCG
jgi:hypothetical protein